MNKREVFLYSLELEVLKRYSIDNKSQAEIGEELEMSQPLVSKILKRVNLKLAQILFDSNAIVSVKNREYDSECTDHLKS